MNNDLKTGDPANDALGALILAANNFANCCDYCCGARDDRDPVVLAKQHADLQDAVRKLRGLMGQHFTDKHEFAPNSGADGAELSAAMPGANDATLAMQRKHFGGVRLPANAEAERRQRLGLAGDAGDRRRLYMSAAIGMKPEHRDALLAAHGIPLAEFLAFEPIERAKWASAQRVEVSAIPGNGMNEVTRAAQERHFGAAATHQ